MDLRKTFNDDVCNYDEARPNYPYELFEAVFDYAPLSENSHVLEIGIGTGQATLPFLQKNMSVTAVELGDRLSAFCKGKFAEFENFSVINDDFLKASLPENSFDLVYSATAFHWIDEKQGFEKINKLLRSGGAVALFWNHPFVGREDDLTNRASSAVYKKYRPAQKTIREFCSADTLRYVGLLEKYGFKDIKTKLFKRIRTLSTEEYLNLINTYSDHLAQPEKIRREFERDMKKAIDEAGGKINIYDTIDLYLAKK
ncbi:MAG: class I SAM-dependent methyltransferase [Ruminococcus sp.]|nr:class I SAM-dependent methyltransferase [Ruminococcus sp.]